MKCGFNKYMGLFVPLYGPFRACLKRAVPVPAHGPWPRPKPGPTLNYFVPCRAWAVLFFSCFGPAHLARPKCTPISICRSSSGLSVVMMFLCGWWTPTCFPAWHALQTLSFSKWILVNPKMCSPFRSLWRFFIPTCASRRCQSQPMLVFYTILKAPVSTVVMRHFFTNNLSHLFQINPLHVYRCQTTSDTG
jgi:hypothetical protein